MRKRFVAIVLALLLLLSFCACSSQSGESSGAQSGERSEASASQSASSAQSEGNETSKQESSASEPSTPQRILAPLAEKVEGAEHLYEITALIPEYEQMVLIDFALQGKDHLLLLYKQNTNFGEFEPAFTLCVLDLTTGAVEILCDRQQVAFEAGVVADLYSPVLVSADPVIVAETFSGTFYFPQDAESPVLRLGQNRYISRAFYRKDTLYVLDTNGELCVWREAEDSFETIWSPGILYRNVAVSQITDGKVFLRVSPLAEAEKTCVFLSIPLESGTVEKAYTIEGDNGEDFYVNSVTVKKRCDESGSWSLAVCTRSGIEYRSDFPKTQALSSFTENGWITLSDPTRASLCFLVRGETGAHYYLWDYALGELYQPDPVTQSPSVPYDVSALPQSIEEFAALIEDRFGIELYLRDAALSFEMNGYEIEPEYDEKEIAGELSVLLEALCVYPENYFTDLGTGKLKIGIVSMMYGADTETVTQANGLTRNGDPGEVLLTESSNLHDIHHELGHVIFNKLLRDGFYNDMMGEFNELNPRSFAYSFSYNNPYNDELWDYTPFSEDPGEEYENVYFASEYAKISNTEDVAELMGHLLGNDPAPEAYKSVHLQEKCRFLFERIRAVFDTASWPKETAWEARLAAAAQA